MHLSLYLPGLLWPHTAATGQTPKLAATEALDNWLRFGNITTAPLSRSQLYAQCLSHPSLLSQCKQELGLPAHQAAFFCSPVLQRVDLHSMSISDGSNLGLSKREAVDICRDFNAFVADSGYKFLPYREYLWLVTCPSEPTWFLPPVCDIEGQLKTVPRPQSDDAKVSAQLQTLQAELQMLLAQHPVNQQRKTTYQAEINGVWFWRDLPSATPCSADIPLLTDAPLLQGSARQQTDAPYDWAAAHTWLAETGTHEQAHLWLNTLEAPSMFADMWGYQDAFAELHTRFLAPIDAALQKGELKSLTLITDGATGLRCQAHKRSRLAFWKRGGEGFAHYLQAASAE